MPVWVSQAIKSPMGTLPRALRWMVMSRSFHKMRMVPDMGLPVQGR